MAGRGDAGIGDEQRARHAEALELPAGVGGGAGPELDRRRLQREDRSCSRVAVIAPRHPSGDGSVLHVTDSLVAGSRGRGRRRATCWSTTTSARPSRSTGRGATAAGRAPSCGRPTPQQVAAVLAACREHGAAVVPQGGNTGMVGAGVPRGGEVVLSTTRLTEPRRRSTARPRRSRPARASRSPRCRRTRAPRASTPASTSARATAPRSAAWSPPTPAASARCATARSARASPGCEAVLADGTVVDAARRCSRTTPATTSPALLVGSEGTLGVITARALAARAALRQPRAPRSCRCASLDAGRRAAARACARGCPRCDAAEFFLDEGLQLVLDHLDAAGAGRAARAASTCCSSARRRATRPTSWPPRSSAAGIEDARRGRPTAPSASGCGACARRTPRRSPPRASRTSSTSASRSTRLADVRRRACRGGRAPGARRARDPLRPPRRRQRPRQRARPRRPTTTPSTRPSCALAAEHAAARSAPSTASAWPRRAGWTLARSPGELARDARDQARARPRRAAQPGRRAAVTRSCTKASLSTTGAGSTNG